MDTWALLKCAGMLDGEPDRKFQGIDIHIENPKGSVRSGTNRFGEAWSRTMQCDYGYVPVLAAGDNEELDVYIGDDAQAPNVYIVQQLSDEGEFDEFKVLLGFSSAPEALGVYLAHYPDEWQENGHIGNFWTVTVDKLKQAISEVDADIVHESDPETDELSRLARRDRSDTERFQEALKRIAPGKQLSELATKEREEVLGLAQRLKSEEH
jgi:hypothetical protein